MSIKSLDNSPYESKIGEKDYNDFYQSPSDLPLELVVNILSNLNDIDMQSTVTVSKSWNIASIDTAKRQQFSLIKDFVNFLRTNLNEKLSDSQRERLFGNGDETIILNSVNLKEVKSSAFKIRETFFNILSELKDKDLDSLRVQLKIVLDKKTD